MRYASSAACAQGLESYEVWPFPVRVSRIDPSMSRLTACASAYGVAGSFVPPTRRIGGAPFTVSGPCPVFGLAGQRPHCRLAYWFHGPKNGEAFANSAPNLS